MDRARTKLLSQIEQSLEPDEQVLAHVHTSAELPGRAFVFEGVLVATDRRMRFRGVKAWGFEVLDESFPYTEIQGLAFSSVGAGITAGDYGTNMTKGRIALRARETQRTFQRHNIVSTSDDAEVKMVVDVAQERRRALPSTPEPAQPPADSSTPESLLRQLASLHAAGVLTDEEFAAKKADVLSRM